MGNTDFKRETTSNHSIPSNPNSLASGPSYGFPALTAGIFGVTISCILAGGGFCIIGLFIGMPLLAIVCGVYAMYVIPREAVLVPHRAKLDPGIRTRHQFRSALRGLILGYAGVTVIWLVFPLTSNDALSTSNQGPGESFPVILVGGLTAFVLSFLFARYVQLRGIKNYQRLYGIGDTDGK